MNFYKENMHVIVDSVFGKGTGIIRHVSDFFFCPVQVELDKPNEDGHKMVRFKFDEIKPLEMTVEQGSEKTLSDKLAERLDFIRNYEEVEPEVEPEEIQEIPEVEPEPEQVEPVTVEQAKKSFIVDENPEINLFVRLKEKITGYSFKKGEVFKASLTGSIYDTCYYIYDIKTGEKRGCMLKECFDIIQEPEIDEIEVFEDENINTPEEPETIEIKEPEQPKVEPEEDSIFEKVEKRVSKLKDTFGKKKPKSVQDALELKGQVTLFDLL